MQFKITIHEDNKQVTKLLIHADSSNEAKDLALEKLGYSDLSHIDQMTTTPIIEK